MPQGSRFGGVAEGVILASWSVVCGIGSRNHNKKAPETGAFERLIANDQRE